MFVPQDALCFENYGIISSVWWLMAAALWCCWLASFYALDRLLNSVFRFFFVHQVVVCEHIECESYSLHGPFFSLSKSSSSSLHSHTEMHSQRLIFKLDSSIKMLICCKSFRNASNWDIYTTYEMGYFVQMASATMAATTTEITATVCAHRTWKRDFYLLTTSPVDSFTQHGI